MSTSDWNVQVYSNEERTRFGTELWAKERKIYESECCYSREEAHEMAEEMMI